MRKIFYFLLLLINCFVFGQTYPQIYPLTGGFTFENQKLDTYATNNNFSPKVSSCNFLITYTYKYFSFKANFDMVFAFDLIAKDPNFRFLVWKLPKDKEPKDVFSGWSTIPADRGIDGQTNVKGLKEGLSNLCEAGNTVPSTGYAKAFEKNDLLKKDETIIIAVYGGSDTDTFDIKVNVAQERTINEFNNLCNGQSYTYQQIFDAVKNDSGLSKIKLFSDSSFNNLIGNEELFSTNTTIYAQVRDENDKLEYIYTIPIQFIPDHQFNFKKLISTEYVCDTTYIIPSQNDLLSKLFDSVDSNYSISSIIINGNSYNIGDSVLLSIGQETDMKIKVHYGGSCPIDSEEKSIPLKQGSPNISNILDTTCASNYIINFDTIYSKLGVDKNQFDLIVILNSSSISDGDSTTINVGTPLVYQVKIVSKSSGCESNAVNFTVTKTSPANILNATINGICLDDFSQININTAITTIQNGNAYQLKYYQADGTTEIVQANLFEYIRTNKSGKIIVKALAVDNSNTICDTAVELLFNLGQSTFIKVDNIPNLNSICSEIGSGYTFTKTTIEDYLKSKLGVNITGFSGISDVILSDNQSSTITFKVQVNGEQCWSEEMQLILQVVTKPDVEYISDPGDIQADCDNLITINESVLNNLFGVTSTTSYDYQIQHNNSTPLIFDSKGKAEIKVVFKNKIDNTCSVEKTIIVRKKEDLVVDKVALETYTNANKIIFCEEDSVGAKNQIQTLLDYIKTQYSTLESNSTVDQIYNEISSGVGNVDIIFQDPNSCGQVNIKFYYQRNSLPPITVPTKGLVCTGELFILDFTLQANYNDYNYVVEKLDGNIISGIDRFDLEVGTYKITIEDRTTGCSIVKTLVVENSPVPVIEKISINQKTIIVNARGNGILEFALFDNNGNVIVNWQKNNILEIPFNITNSNFIVKVRLDNCGISEESDIIYLDLPNVITPNGDSKNDIWKPMTKRGQANDLSHSYKLLIFDRYGKQILSKEGIGIIEWDGTQNGIQLPDDTYWYILESSKDKGIIKVQYSGSILLKRKI